LFQGHALLERKCFCGKEAFDETCTIEQQPSDDMNVHFMAIPANRTVAVDVPVAVYKVIHVAAISFAACHDVLKIKLPCFGEQLVKFFRYILFRSEVVQMWSPFKKREDLLFCPFMSNCFLWVYTYYNSGITSTI
jgi:hypothetical protein